MAVEELKPFNAIKYTTSYGENCVATKKDGVVTIQGDKNGVRQMPLEEFMPVFVKDQQKVNLERTPDKDTVSFSGNDEKSLAEKQEIIKKARKRGAGWSILGGPIATLIYATRNKSKIAEKFDLDVQKDKDLINQIKKEQTTWSLFGAFGIGIIGWIIAACKDSKNIEIES